jgi:hypothetical protein
MEISLRIRGKLLLRDSKKASSMYLLLQMLLAEDLIFLMLI